MESVETGCYEEGGTINSVCNSEGGFVVFYCLKEGKVEAEKDS